MRAPSITAHASSANACGPVAYLHLQVLLNWPAPDQTAVLTPAAAAARLGRYTLLNVSSTSGNVSKVAVSRPSVTGELLTLLPVSLLTRDSTTRMFSTCIRALALKQQRRLDAPFSPNQDITMQVPSAAASNSRTLEPRCPAVVAAPSASPTRQQDRSSCRCTALSPCWRQLPAAGACRRRSRPTASCVRSARPSSFPTADPSTSRCCRNETFSKVCCGAVSAVRWGVSRSSRS
jgi:hypothetical protein